MLGALIYADELSRDDIPECEEASLGFPPKVFLGNKKNKTNLTAKRYELCINHYVITFLPYLSLNCIITFLFLFLTYTCFIS
jgi:hypothetical protein